MKILLSALSLLLCLQGIAQQPMAISDSIVADFQGLKAGYIITDQSEKEVNNKGNFSRYKLKFYVTNTSSEAKIFIKRQGGLFNNGSAQQNIVQFKCSNATGARFTNKEATLQMPVCRIEATVDDKDCNSDKVVQNRRQVDIGYWIKPNETISTSTIMIVPLGEKPVVTAIFYPNNNGTSASIANTDNYGNSNNNNRGFVKIKSFASGNYINNQNGPAVCGKIDNEWWSAQWELIPVNGTSNFQIRNRGKNNFISTGSSSLLTDNGQSANAMWQIEETSTSNVYYIRNVADNSRLVFQNGTLKTSSGYNTNEAVAQWIIEKN